MTVGTTVKVKQSIHSQGKGLSLDSLGFVMDIARLPISARACSYLASMTGSVRRAMPGIPFPVGHEIISVRLIQVESLLDSDRAVRWSSPSARRSQRPRPRAVWRIGGLEKWRSQVA